MIEKCQYLSKELEAHCNEVQSIVNYICSNAYGISNENKARLSRAAEIHDIGKLFVPKEILNAKRALTIEERKLINKHAYLGYVECKELEEDPIVCDLVLLHHGIKTLTSTVKDENIFCSVLALGLYPVLMAADIYSAMTENRVYHKAVPKEKALSIVKENSEIPKTIVKILSCY